MTTSEAIQGQVLPDIYGQIHPVETLELIATKLQEMEVEIQKIPTHERTGLSQAQNTCPQLLTQDWKLMFLRCEVFHANLAAKRYVHYWNKRVEIFGPEKAFQSLTLDGALSDDIVALERGVINLPGSVDATGRSIIYIDPSQQDKTQYTSESMCRAFWYVMHTALIENETTQRKGIVVLGYPHHAKITQLDRKLMKLNGESIRHCLPIRLSGFHVCHPPAFFVVVAPLIKLFMGERLRKRLQLHQGSDERILQRLEGYGIPKEAIPIPLGGDVAIDPQAWVQARRAAGK